MLKGDLRTTPLAPLLLRLAGDSSTGCLRVFDGDEEASVFFKSGHIYAVSIPGLRSKLGAKLVSSGALTPDALADALEAQRTELQGWKLGELLVHMGYVDQPVVETFVKEQVDEALWDLLRWGDGTWKWRAGERTREDVAPPRPVDEMLAALRTRSVEWESIADVVRGPLAVPRLSSRAGVAAEADLGADAWTMLCTVDGRRTLLDLARGSGYTLFEAGQVVVQLVGAGMVEITPESSDNSEAAEEYEGAPEPTDAQPDPSTITDPHPEDALSRLARLVSQVQAQEAGESRPDAATGDDAALAEPERFVRLAPMTVRRNGESFAVSIARVSAALSEVLGEAPTRRPGRRAPIGRPVHDPVREARIREAAAAELAEAQDIANLVRDAGADDESEARLAAQRDETERLEAQRAEAERVEAARLETERAEAARAEAERLEAERVEAERVEAERVEAERVEAERVEAARLEAERVEAARLEAERVEAERLEAERLDVERVELERMAAEQAEVERQRVLSDERLQADCKAAAAAALSELSTEPAGSEPSATGADDPSLDEELARLMVSAAATTTPQGPVTAVPPVDTSDYTDTAALLRELSSLGGDEPPASSPPSPPRAPRPLPAERRKKRGLFGR